jgi:hypothetical protein
MKPTIRAMSALLMLVLFSLMLVAVVTNAGATFTTTPVETTLHLQRVDAAHIERGTTPPSTTTTDLGAGLISSITVE